MRIKEALAAGLTRVRRARWAHPMDHVHLMVGGLCTTLYSPQNESINGRDAISLGPWTGDYDDDSIDDLEAYTGPLPDSGEYRAATREFSAYVERVDVSDRARPG